MRFLALLLITLGATTFAQTTGSKAELTPAFWQRDPEAGFEDEGRMHCAPTSVSDGLIYLARTKGMDDLVPGTSHDSQIELIKDLAEKFGTDPSIGGTNPDKILTGLQDYAKSKGYTLSRLELKSWRGVRAANKKFKIGTKPDMSWMRKAAHEKDAVVIFNVGWYYENGDSYVRKGGHWVEVVDTGDEENEFTVHNPLLQPDRQQHDTSVTLTLIGDEVSVTNDTDDSEKNMKGYYEADGPGLPHGETVKPILDAVIIFSLSKE
jgi:hypothetical protein